MKFKTLDIVKRNEVINDLFNYELTFTIFPFCVKIHDCFDSKHLEHLCKKYSAYYDGDALLIDLELIEV
jgi:hypothetical protein